MEIILMEDVPKLGSIGALVRVAPGYARNFLLPRKLAMAASVKNKRRLEHQKRLVGYRRAKAEAEAQAVAKQLDNITVTIARKVGEQDKLFGSVTVSDLQEALAARGITVDRRKLELSEPLKALGVYEIVARLPGDVRAKIKVAVVAE